MSKESTKSKKYFGTDGIRGEANSFPMTAKMAMKIAMATALTLREGADSPSNNRVVIGKDTRISGYMLEQAMAAGFEAMGVEVIFLGPVPTPAVANLTRSLRADIGVMISASHNPYQDNGIKLFGPDGFKLPDAVEQAIESRIDENLDEYAAAPDKMGKASRLDDAAGRYVESLKQVFPRGQTLEGLNIVLDCANGAGYKVAPQVLWELEANVTAIANQPNGKNINFECGATDTRALQKAVLDEGADLGVALDGDADRLILVDEKGQVIDGDQIMAVLALSMAKNGALKKNTLVTTVMSNLGLERLLDKEGLSLHRTAVGDRYVVEAMKEHGYNLGGEQSGHMVMLDYSTTGDGLLTALQVLSVLVKSGQPASEVLNVFEPLPQILQNVRYQKGLNPLESADVIKAIESAEKNLSDHGRMLVRVSGTEPVIRVMAEGDDQALVKQVVNDVCSVIEQVSS